MVYLPAAECFDRMRYRPRGHPGILWPAISLGTRETFGGCVGEDVARRCLFGGPDLGIRLFHTVSDDGTPAGNSQIVVDRTAEGMPRDELERIEEVTL
jgi:L-glyceraldehyde 3-phosphate reductase